MMVVHVRARGLSGKVKEKCADWEKAPSRCIGEGRGPSKKVAPCLENDRVGRPETSGICRRGKEGGRG